MITAIYFIGAILLSGLLCWFGRGLVADVHYNRLLKKKQRDWDESLAEVHKLRDEKDHLKEENKRLEGIIKRKSFEADNMQMRIRDLQAMNSRLTGTIDNLLSPKGDDVLSQAAGN